ncbi:MAG: hypothetical protein ACU0BK_05440 [Shimia sp.]|uniref:hypothetical protein n=1 Tax=Shimia sp. TaxID=1954381 RepID=UPI004057E749
MKKAELRYSREFLWTPVSGWAGARAWSWTLSKTVGGKMRKPVRKQHPFTNSLKLWCQLCVEVDGLQLRFSTPRELDHFLSVIGQNPMPSGHRLVKGQLLGRPNNHWLSRLPAKAKSGKMRARLVAFLASNRTVAEFRAFYEGKDLQFEAPGFYDDFYEALRASF